jgi:hypothetical protein
MLLTLSGETIVIIHVYRAQNHCSDLTMCRYLIATLFLFIPIRHFSFHLVAAEYASDVASKIRCMPRGASFINHLLLRVSWLSCRCS